MLTYDILSSHATSLQIPSSFSFSQIFRQGNALAHALANTTKFSFHFSVWMEPVSPNLHDCYATDLPTISK